MATNLHDESEPNLVEQAAREKSERGFFGRIFLFFRQVFVELKKVITPTRSELINYTIVVLVFVVLVMGIIWALDTLFGFLVYYVFGSAGR